MCEKHNVTHSSLYKTFTTPPPSDNVEAPKLHPEVKGLLRAASFMQPIRGVVKKQMAIGFGPFAKKKVDKEVPFLREVSAETLARLSKLDMDVDKSIEICEKTLGQSSVSLWNTIRTIRASAGRAHKIWRGRTLETR